MDKIQLTFLQLISSSAIQNITYHCRNTAAYFDKRNSKYENAATFKTYNEIELVPLRPSRFRYSVTLDECQVSFKKLKRCNNIYNKVVLQYLIKRT